MKRKAIYINCYADPWIKVADVLRDKNEIEPIWWIGYSKMDNSHILVPEHFPNIVYQDHTDAWKGRFPKNIEEISPSYYLDIDFLKKHSQHELQAYKMMDRVDQDRHSFNFMERQRHFRNMLKKWNAVIETLKPDIIISTDIPHRLYDYVLYWLCEEKGIPFLMFNHTQFTNRFFVKKNEFYSIAESFVKDWESFEKKDDKTILENIPSDIKRRFEKVKEDYATAAPAYMESYAKREKETASWSFTIKRLFRKFTTVYRPFLFGQTADVTLIGLCAIDKKKNKKYEDSDGNIYQHERMLLKINKYKKQLKKAYESLTVKPDYTDDYVIQFLHYQPEATTCPGGDIFVDQSLCVEVLLRNLPPNYKIYVKEHPHQFNKYHYGHTSRMRDLYDDLVKNPRVKLISIEENTFELIKHSKAISTITGTVGWEAVVRQKPVILFGIGWYENYSKGVLRITDGESEKKIIDFINNYKYNEHSLLAYLASVGKNTRKAYYFRKSGKDELNMTEDECVNNIADSIIEQINS